MWVGTFAQPAETDIPSWSTVDANRKREEQEDFPRSEKNLRKLYEVFTSSFEQSSSHLSKGDCGEPNTMVCSGVVRQRLEFEFQLAIDLPEFT